MTIPRRLRERYAFLPGVEVEFVEDRGRLVLRRKHAKGGDPWVAAVGVLKGRVKDVDAYMDETRGR